MQTYIKIAGETYPASISGNMIDREWGGRASKTIRLIMVYSEAVSIFVDNVPWSILEERDDGTTAEYDNSDYCIAGAITDNRNGTLSIKMGQMTELERLMQDAITTNEYNNAYRKGVDALD